MTVNNSGKNHVSMLYYNHSLWLRQNAWEWIRLAREKCDKGCQKDMETRKRWAVYARRNWRDATWYLKHSKECAKNGGEND